ncbi:hypothetical protein YC2023_091176 [Brassica napus]
MNFFKLLGIYTVQESLSFLILSGFVLPACSVFYFISYLLLKLIFSFAFTSL